MENWLIPLLRLRKFTVSLELVLMTESKKKLKEDRDVSVGHRNQCEGASTCQIWDKLSIKINNDKKVYNLLNKTRICKPILIPINKMISGEEEKAFPYSSISTHKYRRNYGIRNHYLVTTR